MISPRETDKEKLYTTPNNSIDSTSSDDLPSSLRKRFEKTQEIVWGEEMSEEGIRLSAIAKKVGISERDFVGEIEMGARNIRISRLIPDGSGCGFDENYSSKVLGKSMITQNSSQIPESCRTKESQLEDNRIKKEELITNNNNHEPNKQMVVQDLENGLKIQILQPESQPHKPPTQSEVLENLLNPKSIPIEGLKDLLRVKDSLIKSGHLEYKLDKIIEEVSNEAFSSVFNRSTLIMNSSMKRGTKETFTNFSFENLNMKKDEIMSMYNK